nr:urease accessory protein UreD [Marivibrio halodurans]
MLDDGSRSETLRLQRAVGAVRVSAKPGHRRGTTVLDGLYQQGAGKARFPRTHSPWLEAVLLNTAGGITGGDRLTTGVSVADGAHLVATTQTAERVYRSLGEDGCLDATVSVAGGGVCEWLPQETILFDGARLKRTLNVEMADDSRLTLLEPVVLGRQAMGEVVRRARLVDQWRIRRGGRLVFADALRFEETGTLARRRGVLDGARAFASLLHVAPEAEARLEEARAILAGLPGLADPRGDVGAGAGVGVEAGASAWDGMLSLRFVAADGACLRRALMAFLERFRAVALPRVWMM